MVQAFVAATAKGYEFAIESPEEAANILLEANPDLGEELVQASQAWLAGEYQADAEQWGVQSADIWQNYADFLIENEIIESFDGDGAFTNEFLP